MDGKPNPQPHFDRGIVRIEIRCCVLPVRDKSRRKATMGFVADAAAGVGSKSWYNYDYGIMTMIMELSNEENGCRFF
jgi:hypothetical protein